MKKVILISVLLSFVSAVFSQTHFKNFDYLIGNWQGVETGMAGDGIGFRTYTYELAGNYIFVRNQSTFPKTDKKPLGEVHRDVGIFSYNANDSSIVFREFHVEGFTNIYVLNKALSNDSTSIFITREIENNPGNWKAKLVLTKNSDTHFTEEFFIAMDGTNFQPFLKNEWTKVK